MPFGTADLRIEIVFDTVCPWCYVGKRRLERAFRLRPHLAPAVLWTPFMLNPDMPREGMNRKEYLARKFGGADRAARMYAAVEAAGRTEGIAFAFDRIAVTPSSLDSHRLIRFAARFGEPGALIESIMDAYFAKGRDIGDHAVLTDIARRAGLAAAEVAAFLSGNEDSDAVHSEYGRIRRLGVTGVPAFLMGEGNLIAGAQEPAVLARVLDVISAQTPENFSTNSGLR